jgi:hypothetical protein
MGANGLKIRVSAVRFRPGARKATASENRGRRTARATAATPHSLTKTGSGASPGCRGKVPPGRVPQAGIEPLTCAVPGGCPACREMDGRAEPDQLELAEFVAQLECEAPELSPSRDEHCKPCGRCITCRARDLAGVMYCRECGCTDAAGCAEGCWWVEAGLCSVCSPPIKKARRTASGGRQ